MARSERQAHDDAAANHDRQRGSPGSLHASLLNRNCLAVACALFMRRAKPMLCSL
jgi:hypothetical protein